MRDLRRPSDVHPKFTSGLGTKHSNEAARGSNQGMSTVDIATLKCRQIIDFSILELMLTKHCPGLKGFNWDSYLECSKPRVYRVLDALEYYYPDRNRNSLRSSDYAHFPKILDFGSWLGNFSMTLHYESYAPVSSEMWLRYSPSLDAQKNLLARHNIDCIDTAMILGRPQGPTFDTILLMGVIEHIPSSPRRMLDVLYDALKPGGLLILDTPNLAYLPNRRALRRGRSPYVPIHEQFFSEDPFEGHVREYTAEELHWMLRSTGFEILETDFFNYSPTPLSEIPILDHLRLLFAPYRECPVLDRLHMRLDPEKRELVFIVARKK